MYWSCMWQRCDGEVKRIYGRKKKQYFWFSLDLELSVSSGLEAHVRSNRTMANILLAKDATQVVAVDMLTTSKTAGRENEREKSPIGFPVTFSKRPHVFCWSFGAFLPRFTTIHSRDIFHSNALVSGGNKLSEWESMKRWSNFRWKLGVTSAHPCIHFTLSRIFNFNCFHWNCIHMALPQNRRFPTSAISNIQYLF